MNDLKNKYNLNIYNKVKYRIYYSVRDLLQIEGFKTCLFITLTFPDKPSVAVAMKRFNSFNNNALRRNITKGYRVIEPHKDGAPHYHMIVGTGVDVRGDFDFLSYNSSKQFHYKTAKNRLYTRKYAQSANRELKHWWRFLQSLGRYGFGFTNASPIREDGDAAAHYISKYMSDSVRPIAYKGKRMHAALKWKSSISANFSWVHGFSYWLRRAKEKVANEMGYDDYRIFCDVMKWDYGKRWFYYLRDYFTSVAMELERDYVNMLKLKA